MTYITAMLGFDIAARAGEDTSSGRDIEGHKLLCEDVIVHLLAPVRSDGASEEALVS
jgi:hypothetical protein